MLIIKFFFIELSDDSDSEQTGRAESLHFLSFFCGGGSSLVALSTIFDNLLNIRHLHGELLLSINYRFSPYKVFEMW